MKIPRINKIFAGPFLLTIVLGLAIWLAFDGREARIRGEQHRFLDERRSVWQQEDEGRAIRARGKLREWEKASAQETIAALGGPIEAAIKDPELDIRRMLEHMGSACAPANTSVSVTVDQFTEFDVAMVLHEHLSLPELAAISKDFLKRAVPYVAGIRFIQGNEVLAELDSAAIDSVTDWSGVPADSVQALLLAAAIPGQAGLAGGANDSNAAPPNTEALNPDQLTIKDAQTTYKKDSDEHGRALNELVADLNQAAQLDSLQSQSQFESRFRWLDQLAAKLAVEREFFMDQAADMERLLSGKGLDPLIVTIITRGIKERQVDQSVILTNYFQADSAYLDQIRAFLTSMRNYLGEWDVDRTTHRIRFSTVDAQDAYTLGVKSLDASVQVVNDAFQAWANRQAAK
jgi:hypothetical protein